DSVPELRLVALRLDAPAAVEPPPSPRRASRDVDAVSVERVDGRAVTRASRSLAAAVLRRSPDAVLRRSLDAVLRRSPDATAPIVRPLLETARRSLVATVRRLSSPLRT